MALEARERTEAVATLRLFIWLSGLAREVWRRSRELEVRDRQPTLPACWRSSSRVVLSTWAK